MDSYCISSKIHFTGLISHFRTRKAFRVYIYSCSSTILNCHTTNPKSYQEKGKFCSRNISRFVTGSGMSLTFVAVQESDKFQRESFAMRLLYYSVSYIPSQ